MPPSEFSTETFESGTRLTLKHHNGSVTQIDLAENQAIIQFAEVSGAKHTVQLTPEMMAALIKEYNAETTRIKHST